MFGPNVAPLGSTRIHRRTAGMRAAEPSAIVAGHADPARYIGAVDRATASAVDVLRTLLRH